MAAVAVPVPGPGADFVDDFMPHLKSVMALPCGKDGNCGFRGVWRWVDDMLNKVKNEPSNAYPWFNTEKKKEEDEREQ